MNTNTKKLFYLVIASLLTTCCFAQDDEDETIKVNINSNRKYKNEAGLDLAPFQFVLGGSSSAGYPSLFYRRHFIKAKEVKSLSGVKITSYHAYRFRLGSNFSFENFTAPDIRTNWTSPFYYNYYYNRTLSGASSFFVRVGKEKQIRSRRFELFYGYDFFFQYTSTYEYYLYIQNNNQGQPNSNSFNQDWKYDDTTNSFGVASIGGLKYFLIPRLCFSAEATINFTYFQQTKTQTYRSYDNATQVYSSQNVPLSTSGVKLTVNPVYIVNVGYYF